MKPKVFISYSWSSPAHQELVREWAERLAADGVDIILDIYELKEGQDKYTFMERMVTDPQVSHVLVFSDKRYAEKADARKAGVGTESQIISKEVYEKVNQTKFIPIICELDDKGEPILPTFFKSRIWIDFSSPEAVNENWEKLIRLLFGKPLHQKPTIGSPPPYVGEDADAVPNPATAKFQSLRQALLQGKKGVGLYRKDFLDACISYADALRVRKRPSQDDLGEKILADCGQLVSVRNHIVDWIVLEAEINPGSDFSEILIDVLERLRDLKSRPAELNEWRDSWFEAHSLFVYETFLYAIAALLKAGAYEDLRNVYLSHYLLPSTERYGEKVFESFETFYATSQNLNSVLAPPGKRLLSPSAELIKRQAQRTDIPFKEIMQAESLTFLMALLSSDVRWYPGTLLYAGYAAEFPFFVRAMQHKHFVKLARITGFDDVDALRKAVQVGRERLQVERWNYTYHGTSFSSGWNLDKLDSIK